MSYNNIGLSTPRGSGTSGFIQSNKAHIHKRRYDPLTARRLAEKDNDLEIRREIRKQPADKGIELHDKARNIEVKCMEFRIKLEDKQEREDEIERQVSELRKKLLIEAQRETPPAVRGYRNLRNSRDFQRSRRSIDRYGGHTSSRNAQ
ncbi:uncharacterized protein V1516DRAFT_298219 [Lipomyces oligophaga]|uniref:uncharacterized protein n=1 Tax=Lipomyces oligophaga TaxID=45792 RepID=UPI0034CE179D